MFVGQQVLLINGGREVSFDAQKTEKRCHPDTPMRPNCPRFEKSSHPLYLRAWGSAGLSTGCLNYVTIEG